MRMYRKLGAIAALAAALVLVAGPVRSSYAGADYRFKVHNNTKQDIKKILVSEDGKKWGYFDIGDGIKAGETEELVWDKSTDKEGCEQWFKAVFANGEESEPVKFDFCEKGLVLEFN